MPRKRPPKSSIVSKTPTSPQTNSILDAFALKNVPHATLESRVDHASTNNELGAVKTPYKEVLVGNNEPGEYPQTPVSRIATKDFVGDIEHSPLKLFGKGVPSSLDERISWCVSPRASSATSLNT